MDSREEKVEAFRLFDFDKSDEYKAYMRNIDVLPPGDKALLKVKAKWYKRTVDPDFDLEWLPGLASSQPSHPAAPQPTAAPQQRQQQQQQAQPAGSRAARSTLQWAQGRKLNLAVLQALILAFSVIYLQPVSRAWSSWAYGKLVIMLVVSQGLKVHTAHGMPASWRLEGIKQWMMQVLPTADAQYFLLSFAAVPNKPVTALLPPFIVLAAYHLAHFLAETFPQHPLWQRHGQFIYRQMQAKQQVALAFNAQSEIGLGFMLLVGIIFPGRAPTFAFMVWQFLRMRYWSADAAVYHRQAWAALGQMTANFRQQLPILQKAVDLGAGFFNQGRQAAP